MAHITLGRPSVGERVLGGVKFVDGEGDAELTGNRRGYFEAIGATIDDGKRRSELPDTDWTKAELLAYADEHGVEGTFGTKADILEAIHAPTE